MLINIEFMLILATVDRNYSVDLFCTAEMKFIPPPGMSVFLGPDDDEEFVVTGDIGVWSRSKDLVRMHLECKEFDTQEEVDKEVAGLIGYCGFVTEPQ